MNLNRLLTVVFFLVCISTSSTAQIFPTEDQKLHYRIIGFRFPAFASTQPCKLEISEGNWNQDDSFRKHIVKSLLVKTNKVIVEVPQFGRNYTWRVTTDKAYHHFSTLTSPVTDTAKTRFRIIQKAAKYQDAYVFLDAMRGLYDMKGNLVWFLPQKEQPNQGFVVLKDLKPTNANSITFMFENQDCFDIDYDGNILWQTPARRSVGNDTVEHFHHEFTRMANGHYMVMGSDMAFWDKSIAAYNDERSLHFQAQFSGLDSTRPWAFLPFGTLIEYDKDQNVVWSWRSSDYLKKSDIFNHFNSRGQLDISSHSNSFFFNEKSKTIYVSFRDLSRIVKIRYPDGKVLKEYGERFRPDFPQEIGNGLFCKQHAVKISSTGLLYLFNNNYCGEGTYPKVIMMKEPTLPGDSKLKKVWEYQCTIEGQKGKTQTAYTFNHGGNVVELPDHSIFTSMSTLYSKVFIVSPAKKELWSGIPEIWNPQFKAWENVIQYKASMINTRKELEKMIWASQAQK